MTTCYKDCQEYSKNLFLDPKTQDLCKTALNTPSPSETPYIFQALLVLKFYIGNSLVTNSIPFEDVRNGNWPSRLNHGVFLDRVRVNPEAINTLHTKMASLLDYIIKSNNPMLPYLSSLLICLAQAPLIISNFISGCTRKNDS